MICYVFKLNEYVDETKKSYQFVDGLFKINNILKKETIEGLGINYSAYRVEKTRDIVKNDNISKLLSFFEFNNVNKENIKKYEILFSKIYYCCYYGNSKSYDFYLTQIEELLKNKDIIFPILVLFKVFICFNKILDFEKCRNYLKDELEFLYAIYNTDYFSGDLKYLYFLMLFYFDQLNDVDLLFVKKFCYKEPKIAWIYYSVKAQKAYINQNDLETIMYTEILIKEYKNNTNMNKYLYAINNLAYSYNLEYEYVASLSYTENVIEYLFSSTEHKIWIKYIFVHFLYSKFMLKEYDEIINFLNIYPIEKEYLLDVSAVICLVTAYITKNIKFYDRIIDMVNGDFYYFTGFLKYIQTDDETMLVFNDNPPYIKRLKPFIKNKF